MNLLKKNFGLALIILVLSFTTVLPHLYGLVSYGSEYLSLGVRQNMQYTRDETYAYAAEVQQILRGEWRGDSYLWEYRKSPSPFLGEIASIMPIIAISKFVGSVSFGFIITDFIFPLVLFIVIFLFLTRFGFKKIFAISTSLAVVITPFLSSLIPFIHKNGSFLTGPSNDPLFITRTPHPQISLIFLFLALFFTVEVLTNPTRKIVCAWLLAIGISLYSSPFVASSIALGTLLLSPLILPRLKTKTFVLSMITIFILSLPYLINALNLQAAFKNNEFLLRASSSVDFVFPNQLRYILFAIILFFLRRDTISKVILAYVVGASLMADGHQLLLGRNIDSDHWISRVIAPLSSLTLFLILEKIIHFKSKIFLRCIWATLASVLLLVGFFKQLTWIRSHKADLEPDYALQSLIRQIETQTGKDDVINSFSFEINQYLTGLTARRIYYGPMERVLASSNEQLERLCDLHKLSLKYNQEDITQFLNYETELENTRLNKQIDKNKFKNQCDAEKSNTPRYKLNFLIAKDQSSGEYRLIKAGI